MKIVQVNTNDIRGGAARAAFRLHKGLLLSGEQSCIVVRIKGSDDRNVIHVSLTKPKEQLIDEFHLCSAIQGHYINNNRTDTTNTIFSFAYPGYDLTNIRVMCDADIINLHWINYFQSLATLVKLFALGKPVIWTLHDQWAFTGGCHYSAGCVKYKHDCDECPQLNDDPFKIASAILKDKIQYFNGKNLTIVTPSRWLAQCAQESKTFNNFRIEVIPNSIEDDIFSPQNVDEAKRTLNIAPRTRTILFGAEAGSEIRKGFKELMDALKICAKNEGFKKLLHEGNVKLLSFGSPNNNISSLGIPHVSLGYINDDNELRVVYNAADIYILPSLEDNLPNTVLESMSCGTPVVAFDTGGMPDLISDGKTGLLAECRNVEQLAGAVIEMLMNSRLTKEMGIQCRELITKRYALSVQSNRYLNLYKELLNDKRLYNRRDEIVYQDNAVKNDKGSKEATLDTSVGPYTAKIYKKIIKKTLNEITLPKWFITLVNDSNRDKNKSIKILNKISQFIKIRFYHSKFTLKQRLRLLKEKMY